MNRREFVKNVGFAIVAELMFPLFGFTASSNGIKKRPSPLHVTETDTKAVELGFRLDATRVDIAKWSKRAGPEGATKFCHNCQFFKAVDSKFGNCQTYKALVPKDGWCNAWIKKST
jgi:hypothetical protein